MPSRIARSAISRPPKPAWPDGIGPTAGTQAGGLPAEAGALTTPDRPLSPPPTTVVYGGAVCTLCQWPPVPLRDFGPRTLSFLGLKSRNQPMLRDLAPSMLRPLGLRSRNRPERAVPYCLGIAVIDVVLSQEMITPEGTAPTHFPHYRTCPITCPITRKDLIVIVSNRSGNMFTMGACVCRR